MTLEEKKDLLKRYLDGNCSEEEKQVVLNWYVDITAHAPNPEVADDELSVGKEIWASLGIPRRRDVIVRRWMAAAAAVLFIGLGTWYYTVSYRQSITEGKEALLVTDVQPGSNRAILKLDDGKEINLDQVKTGQIAQVPGVVITKTAAGKIVYQINEDTNPNAPLRYNTITTPRGGQYQVILPDGTTVYLNAESSLKYPTKFASFNRSVSLTGEAYFTVVKNPQKPFVVQCSDRQVVQVLGTRFNVRQFLNEPIKTTLEEGKVEISANNNTQKATLKPGDQSIVSSQGIVIRKVDPEEAIAWKNGMFIFHDTSIREVLQEISRWYDVEVDYFNIPDFSLETEIPRTISLLKVLEYINTYSEYKFTLNQERRIVLK